MSNTIYVLCRNKKNIRIFYLKFLIILLVKFSVYLNRHVFVMATHCNEYNNICLNGEIRNILVLFSQKYMYLGNSIR